MEARKLFAADSRIFVGAVYYEEATGDDHQGDTIQITFTGGAPGTELTRILIDGHKNPATSGLLENGDVFFDTKDGGSGVFNSVPLTWKSSVNFEVLAANVVDGGSKLEVLLRGFNAGDILELNVDVDEKTFLSSTAVAEGGEFEGSHLWADFKAEHYEPGTAHAVFWDFYDENFAKYGDPLTLPPDRYEPPSGVNREDRTAGAIVDFTQKPLPNALGGRVYIDHNRDLSQGVGEAGLAGVQITLRKQGDAAFVRTTRTNASGDYRFDNLEPGVYSVHEAQPSEYRSVGAVPGRVSGVTRGQVNGADEIRQIELLGGEESVRNDFAEYLPAALSGYVYHDRNDDGRKGAGEEGIAGVEIRVLPEDLTGGSIVTVYTNSDGYWSALDLVPGSYRVEEVQPANYQDGKDSVGSAGGVLAPAGDVFTQVRLAPGVNGQRYDFGELLPASISGVVLIDSDDDCLFDAGERGLAGVRIELLDERGVMVRETVTDANGKYEFTGLKPGVYSVRETQPFDYFEGKTRPGSAGGIAEGNVISQIALGSGVASTDNNFCEVPPASLAGMVFADLDDDCFLDEGEIGLAGVTIELLNEQGVVVAKTETEADGTYKFERLEPGIYSIRESQPSGYLDGGEKIGSAGGRLRANDWIENINLEQGVSATGYDFCELPPASLAGAVFADLDDDCLRDAEEVGLENVLIELLNDRGEVVATTRTSANGDYRFDQLRPGVYSIREQQPQGYLDGGEKVGTAGGRVIDNDHLGEIHLQGGVNATDYIFCEVPPASLSGVVIADIDNDCIQDVGEAGISGVFIELLDEKGVVVRSTYTNVKGEYEFKDLRPGTYSIRESQPSTYLDGGETVGTLGGAVVANDHLGGINLLGGQNGEQYNFCELPPASLSGFVHVDEDGDCVFDSNERPIAGVIIQLLNEAGEVAAQAQTNAVGAYHFDMLPPGKYAVREIQPEGYTTAGEKPGSLGGRVVADNLIGEIRVTIGAIGVEYNFCETAPEIPIVFSIDTPPLTPLERIVQYVPFERDPLTPEIFTPPEKPYLRLDVPGAPPAWHLSVVDAGRPRRSRGTIVDKASPHLAAVSAKGKAAVRNGLFKLKTALRETADADPSDQRLTMPQGKPVTGDFNGDGRTDFGVYINGEWFIDLTSDRVWNEGDLWAKLGNDQDEPITGDWDGDGKTDIGIYGMAWAKDREAIEAEPGLPDPVNVREGRMKNPPPSLEEATSGNRNMRFNEGDEQRRDIIDHVFAYGARGDQPISGDWDGDGVDTIGVFRDGLWYLDVDGDGRWTKLDRMLEFGIRGDKAVAGDWNGDGVDEIGVYRHGVWRLDVNNDGRFTSADRQERLGGSPGDAPVVGDWDGDGTDEIGVYTQSSVTTNEQATAAPTG